jgi:hypothetical protein
MPGEIVTYVGDGVYASFDGFNIWIWTDNGIDQSAKIALEPAVLDHLNKFAEGCLKAQRDRLIASS